MTCLHCGQRIEKCEWKTCGLGYVHAETHSHYCDDPPQHGANPVRFAEVDPAPPNDWTEEALVSAWTT